MHVGHRMFFSPVCFFPCLAAWPEVVKVSWQLNLAAWGQGYFFLAFVMAPAAALFPLPPLELAGAELESTGGRAGSATAANDVGDASEAVPSAGATGKGSMRFVANWYCTWGAMPYISSNPAWFRFGKLLNRFVCEAETGRAP